MVALAFLSVCMDSCACVSLCLYGILSLLFSVFVCALVLVLVFLSVSLVTLVLAFLSVCMDFCACACVSQCLYVLFCLRFSVLVRTLILCLRFLVFVWTLMLSLVYELINCCAVYFPRARRSHWENLNPASGRPLSSAFAKLDRQWDLQPGHNDMSQGTAMTSDEELKELATRSHEK